MVVLERLLAGLQDACGAFPDKRKGAVTYSMADAGMSAFSLFFMQSESFLAYQRSLVDERKTSNCQTLFGMTKIPTDATIRSLLDPVHPRHLQRSFDQALAVMRERGGMKAFERLGGRVLIVLDGTEYFCSQKLGCAHCQTRKRSNGKTDYYHSMLAASIVAPDHNMVLPLMPEFIVKPDGAGKQDCERNACKRWLLAHGERVKHLRPIYLGDDLFACQPICEAVTAADGDFLMTAKPESHIALYDFMRGADIQERTVTRKQAGKKLAYRYRWFSGAPLRDGNDALAVNWLGVTISDANGKVTYDGAFVTSLAVSHDTVAEIAGSARARWKIENETFNVLKNNGYHLEHNFGHGKENLAMTFAALNLLAFAYHTVCDCLENLWIAAREAKRARKRFFEHIRTITAYLVFPNWDTMMTTLIKSKPPPEIASQILG
jgi:hypothetical protein